MHNFSSQFEQYFSAIPVLFFSEHGSQIVSMIDEIPGEYSSSSLVMENHQRTDVYFPAHAFVFDMGGSVHTAVNFSPDMSSR